ncbi:MAG: selenide, water dikinase SelD, partial [Bacteroidales bacterium]|nr:selenide, water dikinase SelD [Bacteroidales bacterium]
GKACEVAGEQIEINAERMKTLRDRLQSVLLEKLPDAVVNGHPENRLPNTLSISFPGIEAQTLLGSMEQLAASAGAACHADQVTASSVLQAMQIEDEFAMGTVRFSLGKMTTREEVDKATGMIVKAVKTLAGDSGEKPSGVEVVQLTHFTHGLGCACKLRPQDLEQVLRDLPAGDDPRILIGPETADDAAVFKIRDDLALVKTVDFFTPIVDDPYHFGAIAASNALSDIYAMGARPLFALNIVGFPVKRLDLSVLKEILRGAHDKAREAGITVLGGHTIEDTEPKYGMVVTGEVHPQKIWSNRGARPGDQVILTKPVGTGVMSTALKRGILTTDQQKRLIEVMSRLNRNAAEMLFDFTPHACTDVTGFGLLGHLLEMSRSSRVNVTIDPQQVPLLTGLMELIGSGIIPGGTKSNIEYLKPWINEAQNVPDNMMTMLCDAQTSGGLLIALPGKEADLYIKRMKAAGNTEVASIGRFTETGTGQITIAASERE